MKQALPWIAVVVVVLLMLDVGVPVGDAPADPDDPTLQILGDPALEVVEMDAADVPMDCPEPRSCDADYRAFLERVAEQHSPRDAGQLLAELAALEPASAPAIEGEPREGIAAAAGLGFLLEGLDERELLVVERSNRADSGIQQIRLGMEDPFVGVVEALFLMPGTPPPWSGLVVYPGAGGSLDSGRDAVDGVALAMAGVAVVVVQPRLAGGDALEAELSLGLLSAGGSLLAARTYELLLARKYLRWRADVRADRLALAVGDGGAEVGEVTARLADWTALLAPAEVDFLALAEDGRPTASTVPGLVGLAGQPIDESGLGAPVRRFPPGEAPPPGEAAGFLRGALLPPPVDGSDLDASPAVGADLGQGEGEHAQAGEQQPQPESEDAQPEGEAQ